jgi:hypothetical protein
MPERQYTLRATVEWSVGLLDDAERSLLETVAVFVDGWTVEAAAEVAGLDEDRALDLTEALAGHSLIYLDVTDHGPRSRMLETIRGFVAERLAARTDAAEIQRCHADYYRKLAEQADRPLRRIGHREWLELLQAEAGNLAATVHWYLDNDRAPLPHLFRVLWPFWALGGPHGRGPDLGRSPEPWTGTTRAGPTERPPLRELERPIRQFGACSSRPTSTPAAAVATTCARSHLSPGSRSAGSRRYSSWSS